MTDLLWEKAPHEFVFITVLIGGAGAWLTGRALARAWKPLWMALLYMVPMSLAVRFLHFALADGTLLSLHYWGVDLVWVICVAAVSWAMNRAACMVAQYPWLYERTSPFTWREKAG